MKRGRPIGSPVRQNIIEVLYFLGSAHGYHIYKIYKQIFPKITLRGIYYHLKKGLELGELIIDEVQKESGSYSWGSEAEKTYYKLGPKAKPKMDARVKVFLETQNPKK
ncbi:hypothetical protein K9L67_01405 [Candidatus Woesearchaeota archaeon]|nr:hypothetical protein [Candidatus Woesearchaeota archaeon]MCF7900861.1 hypothetical protein [Candidatus Woesearchaeota archaeon]MCF8014023.1 hypothetical protein [Candidatus Woesearchaeota archaeon]